MKPRQRVKQCANISSISALPSSGELYIVGEFHGREDNSTLGRLGDIRGKPSVEDLAKIKKDSEQLAKSLIVSDMKTVSLPDKISDDLAKVAEELTFMAKKPISEVDGGEPTNRSLPCTPKQPLCAGLV